MPIYEASPAIRTGLKRHNPNPGMQRQRRKAGIGRVSNPLKTSDAPQWGPRAQAIGSKPPFDFEAITKAYLVDPIYRQALDKHAELVLKEGYFLKGEPEPVAYLRKRLQRMSGATGIPWSVVVDTFVRDIIKYGNAFLLIARAGVQAIDLDTPASPLEGHSPIGAYWNLPVDQLFPVFNDNGVQTHWVRRLGNEEQPFPVKNVFHMVYCRPGGALWGAPYALGVVEDLRSYRQMEETMSKMVDKFGNPLIHQETPDITGTGEGRQEDVDDSGYIYQSMAPDGIIVTPPGHKFNIIGAESHALRIDPYINHWEERLYAGLGVSDIIMGKASQVGAYPSELITAPMHDRAKYFQEIIAEQVTYGVLFELLMEGGYDPWNDERDVVTWEWHELEVDRRIKEETHELNKFTMNTQTLDEVRNKFKNSSLTPEEEQGLYINKVQIPQITAVHRLLREEIRHEDIDYGNTKLPKDNKASKNKIQPTNQYGKKFSPGATTAHKLSVEDKARLCESVLEWLELYRLDASSDIDLDRILENFLEAVPLKLKEDILLHAKEVDPIMGMVLIQRILLTIV